MILYAWDDDEYSFDDKALIKKVRTHESSMDKIEITWLSTLEKWIGKDK